MCDISVKYIEINVYFVTEMCDISVKCIHDECSFFPHIMCQEYLKMYFCVKAFVLNHLFSVIFHWNMIWWNRHFVHPAPKPASILSTYANLTGILSTGILSVHRVNLYVDWPWLAYICIKWPQSIWLYHKKTRSGLLHCWLWALSFPYTPHQKCGNPWWYTPPIYN